MRLGEKEALDSTLRWFEARADRIASLEFYQVPRHSLTLTTNNMVPTNHQVSSTFSFLLRVGGLCQSDAASSKVCRSL